MKFFFDLYLFTSGGALASLFLGLVVKELWRHRLPGFLASKVRQEAALLFHNLKLTAIIPKPDNYHGLSCQCLRAVTAQRRCAESVV